jgi:hypothetical protein
MQWTGRKASLPVAKFGVNRISRCVNDMKIKEKLWGEVVLVNSHS